jgi:hypothetical protein
MDTENVFMEWLHSMVCLFLVFLLCLWVWQILFQEVYYFARFPCINLFFFRWYFNSYNYLKSDLIV